MSDATPEYVIHTRRLRGVYYYVAFSLLGLSHCNPHHPTESEVDELLRSGAVRFQNVAHFQIATGLDRELIDEVVLAGDVARARPIRVVPDPVESLPIDAADRLVRLARLTAAVIDRFAGDRDAGVAWLQASSTDGRPRVLAAQTEPGCGAIIDELHTTPGLASTS